MGKSQGLVWKATASILALVAQGERWGRRGPACSGVRDYWGHSRRKSFPPMPLSALYSERVYVGGREGLRREKQRVFVGRGEGFPRGITRLSGEKELRAETRRGRSSRSFFTLLQMPSGCDRFRNHTRSLLKMAATYSPTVTQYHRHNWA